jgi:iron complex outermembrane receptor protein
MTVTPASFLALVCASGGEVPQVSAVPEEGDETVVSARKQTEPLAEVPLSVTAIDGRELELERLFTVRDAGARVPNLFLSEFTSRRLSFPFVRGVGSGLGDPSVITYVDDVPQFGFGGTNLPLVAVDRLEFLRGPQGTLYGKNSMGGLIHVHGRRPGDEPRVELGGTLGNYDLREVSGSYSGPLGAGLRGDFALLDSQRDGYSTNKLTGDDVDDRNGLFGRGRVLYNPTSASELDLSFFGERARDGGFALNFLEDVPAFGITGLRNESHQINQDFEGSADRDVLSPSVVWRVLGDALDFTSVSSYEHWDVLELSDFDFTPVDGVRRRSEEEQSYFYQELRLGTSAGERDDRLSWQVGASGFLSDADRSSANTLRPGGAGIFFPPGSEGTDATAGDFDDFGWALFGQASLPVGAFALEAGLRYDNEKKEVDSAHTFDPGIGPIPLDQRSQDETFDELLPMAGLTWHTSLASLAYLRAARGFKAGGFNLSTIAAPETFDAETNWTYELGYRQSFLDERTTLSGALFFVDWQDRQVSLFNQQDGGFVDNAGDAESKGVELEGEAKLLDNLDARASFGLADTEISDTGEDLPQAPDSTWSVGLRYANDLPREGTWYVRADYQNVGDFFYDDANNAGDSYDLVNAGVGIDLGRFGFSVWCQNLFDEEYVPIAFQANPADPNSFVGESGAPRVLGFTLSVHL